MKTGEVRASFLKFFEEKGHEVMDSSSLVPHNDPTLMFSNAGMNQFKNVFSGAEILKDKSGKKITRATTSQKCVRAGGKHNDLDNVGYTARHHTFFEMLGNFSFGDYFKQDAIKFAWEFLTSDKWMGLPKDKLSVTVYHTDDEAFNIWKEVTNFPDEKIMRIATSDNFWSMGDTGPCGPCSEIFYDHGQGKGEWKLDKDGHDLFGERYVEIWNLVFMQFEKLADGSQIDLPKPCIDTGMGLERMSAVKQGKHDNYDIDLFENLIKASKKETGNSDKKLESSHRVIADHLRSTSFLLADGVMPSNEGRGYVLRRIMRRAMRHAHILGCVEPLMYKLVPSLIKEMGDAFPEIKRAEALITETLKHEEEKFKETLGKGIKLLEDETKNLKEGDSLKGEVAFKLYDTYGFPLDLTQDILRGQNMEVDTGGFDKSMEAQKAKARAAWSGSGGAATESIWFDIKEKTGATEFLGYETLEARGVVSAIIKDGSQVENAKQGDEVSIVTNQTPFYGESGGQAGDKGIIKTDDLEIEIFDTKKHLGEVFDHIGKIKKGEIKVGEEVELHVSEKRRNALRANHSATHILHAALRKNLGEHVTQKGSLVEEDYFRFDFSNPKGIEKDVLEKIEKEVNDIIKKGGPVETKLMTPDEAIEQGAMALFGEKYGDEVRVVSMGNSKYSVELCGGTHVENTKDIELLKIVREGSVSSGVRRIEAKTGAAAKEFIKEQEGKKSEEEKAQKEKEAKRAEAAKNVGNVKQEFIDGIGSAEKIGDVVFYGFAGDGIHPKDLRSFVDDFKKQVDSGVVVIVASNDGKAAIVVGVTENLTEKISAVDLVRVGSEALGGKGGGGRPDFAQAGGPSAENASEAINNIKSQVA